MLATVLLLEDRLDDLDPVLNSLLQHGHDTCILSSSFDILQVDLWNANIHVAVDLHHSLVHMPCELLRERQNLILDVGGQVDCVGLILLGQTSCSGRLRGSLLSCFLCYALFGFSLCSLFGSSFGTFSSLLLPFLASLRLCRGCSAPALAALLTAVHAFAQRWHKDLPHHQLQVSQEGALDAAERELCAHVVDFPCNLLGHIQAKSI
mmetsp:Transcript_68391/g.120799  ORF Transcript_68391/g.120799 Transcript_68391/m.120799 type:complete len:207 (+) Transcript_68391:1010-1630(+)